MNSKLVKASLAGAAAIALAAGGGTFAAWSDFANTGTNTAQAGILKLDQPFLSNSSIPTLGLAPGIGKDQYTYLASSDGQSVPDGNLFISLQNLVNAPDVCNTNSETTVDNSSIDPAKNCSTGAGDLGNEALVRIEAYPPPADAPFPATQPCRDGTQSVTTIFAGTLGSAATNAFQHLKVATLSRGEPICVHTMVELLRNAAPAPAPNTFAGTAVPAATDATQGDTATWTMRYDLEQV